MSEDSSAPLVSTRPALGLQRPRFVNQVVQCLQKRFPEEIADRSWDNTGLLLDSLAEDQNTPVVMLTNDLTSRVADEAIDKKVAMIVTYHPLIFSGIKALVTSNPQHRSILKLAYHGIAVYSPHTAVDTSPFGNCVWLAKLIAGPQQASLTTICPFQHPPAGFESAGHGIQGSVAAPGLRVIDVIRRLSEGLGLPAEGPLRHILVARPRGPGQTSLDELRVRSFAVAAGSGFAIVRDVEAELVVLGELTHHNALYLVERGRTVLAVLHSNSERQFLRVELQPWLEAELRTKTPAASVLISESDDDPIRVFDVATELGVRAGDYSA